MTLTIDNVIQENSGSNTTSPTVVTLPAGTTAGSTVVVITSTSGITPPSDMTLDRQIGAYVQSFHKSDVAAGETSWSFNNGGGGATWYVTELSGVDLVEPLDSSAASLGGVTVNNGGTLSTGTAPLNAAVNTVVFAAFASTQAVGGSVESWSGYTNGFTEVADLYPPTGGMALGVARKIVSGTTAAFESTATLATTQASPPTGAILVAYRAADSPNVSPLAHFVGFEHGMHAGINSHTGVSNMMSTALSSASGTFGTSYLIQAGSARNSSYGLRIVQSATTAFVRTGSLGSGGGAFGLNVRVVSATGTVVVASVVAQATSPPSTGYYAQIVYDSATTKFGVRLYGNAASTVWETGTTALSTWRWIDLKMDGRGTTHKADWRIETATDTYTDQGQATFGGVSTLTSQIYGFELGYNGSQTMTADYDDVVMSRYNAAFPLGPHQIRLLTVDPAGTPTLSGTTTNFSVFTANTTLGAWNATNARNAVDEVPPTISASADGLTQTASAASDYVEFPMSTYTATSTEIIVGVRMLAALWSGTGAGAGDLAIRGYDGTTETALATASQITPGSATAISATVPVWRTAMWQSPNGWNQAELNAVAVRVGFSGDATPDMGVHVVYLEVAVGKTRSAQAIGGIATMEVNPNTLGVVSGTAIAPVDSDVTFRWTDSGGPGSQAVAAGASHTRQFNAADASEVERFEIEIAPELPDRE